jgi:hypothetical protein
MAGLRRRRRGRCFNPVASAWLEAGNPVLSMVGAFGEDKAIFLLYRLKALQRCQQTLSGEFIRHQVDRQTFLAGSFGRYRADAGNEG